MVAHVAGGGASAADQEDVAERLHWQLFRLTSSFRRHDQNQLAVGGLTLTQASILSTLHQRGSMRIGELAMFEKVSAPTTTQAVGRLESAGLVTRVRDGADHRVMRIEITPQGEAVLRSTLDDFLEVIVAELSDAEIAALNAALVPLERISRAMEAISSDERPPLCAPNR